jgi:hypothetical protein
MRLERTVLFRIVLLVIFPLVLALVWYASNPYRSYLPQQWQLARQLGISIRDYPQPEAFPTGYFRQQLKPGMSIDQVHAVMQGYEGVRACKETNTEIYEYFSKNPARALRFEVVYTPGLVFEGLGTEDPGQRTISVEGCIEGKQLAGRVE